MAWPPLISDFKAQFNREFIYGSGLDTVQDGDITRGLNQAGMVFNPDVWISDSERQTAYLYEAAHFLVLNIQAAGGLSAVLRGRSVNNQGGGVIESKSVGGVSVNYALPDYVRQDPILSGFEATGFGMTYLQMFLPRRVGNAVVVSGQPPGFSFAGNVPTLIISTQTLPNGTHSVPYSQQIASTGGLAPITWSLMTGTLPTGLGLSASGLISGTPTVINTFNFRVRAVDRQQQATGQSYTVVIS